MFIFKQELHYLGHLLTTNGIKPQNEEVMVISEMKPPTNQTGVEEILGIAEYYRKFISRFADAVRPMTKVNRKYCKFEWSEDSQSGFEYLKTCLTESPILKYPNPQKRYVVFTDALDQAAAAVLIQEYNIDGEMKEMSIAYLSAQFSDTQFKWSTVVKEGYAIYYAIKKWRHYLEDEEILLKSDVTSLQKFLNGRTYKWRHYLEDEEILLKSDVTSLQKFLNGRTDSLKLDRWSLELHGRNIQVEHIPGY